VFDEYSEYFGVAIHSHFTALVLALWRLFDPASDVISLKTIRSRIGPRQDFPQAVLRSYTSGIRFADPLLKKLEIVRHKFLAHRDAAYTIERTFKEADFKYGDLATLVDSALKLVNVLRAERGRGSYRFPNRTSANLVRLIRCLHGQETRTSLRPLEALAWSEAQQAVTASSIKNGGSQGRRA
jgi:hypothetical protein